MVVVANQSDIIEYVGRVGHQCFHANGPHDPDPCKSRGAVHAFLATHINSVLARVELRAVEVSEEFFDFEAAHHQYRWCISQR